MSDPRSGEDADLDARAKALWDAMPTVKPSWDQLGDVTKGVWREKAREGGTGVPRPTALPPPARPLDEGTAPASAAPTARRSAKKPAPADPPEQPSLF